VFSVRKVRVASLYSAHHLPNLTCADATEEQTMPSELLRVQGSIDNHQFVSTEECRSFSADLAGAGTCVMNYKESELALHFQQ
jgi:hypothetical protein